MRGFTLLCSATLLVACGKTETPPVDTMAVAPAAPEAAPAPAPIALKDVAGKYAFTTKNETGDTTLLTFELNATADTTGWTLTFPKRAPIEQRVVSVAGDSIVLEAGPYDSEIYKGAKVTTHTVYRLQDGKLVGRTVARYNRTGPDSMRILMSEGIRK